MPEFQRVSAADLKRMCLSAGLPFPEEEIDRLISTCPKDEGDKVSFEDFIVHLEKNQMELINGPEPSKEYIEPEAERSGDARLQYMLQQENERLKHTVEDLQNKLAVRGNGGPSVSATATEDASAKGAKPVLPKIPADDSAFVKRVTRSNNQTKGISNVFPDITSKDALPQIDAKNGGRKKYNIDPPTEDIFGNKIQTEKAAPVPEWTVDSHRPVPDISMIILENIRACMDRNNKRALADVTSTIDRWNGGCIMTRRMLTKIIKHSGLRLPNETVRILFDKLDVLADGTVVLHDFFKVFKDAENSAPKGDNDPAQISRNRRAEMQNRAAPWATM